MSYLLSKNKKNDNNSLIQKVTPQSANWKYVGFEVQALAKSGSINIESLSDEICVVILSGKVDASTRTESWQNIGERMSVFERKAPYSIYSPADDFVSLTALTDVEVAICRAPGKGGYQAKLITPEQCQYETRGINTNTRHVCNILFANEPADSLLVCEVITPSGNWSSYPPHKHDTDAAPTETQLEETYYHKIDPPQGFVFQRVYNDDRSLDETMSVEDGDLVMVPEGYHPVGVPHGYQSYYLNVMAGPSRNWIFNNDPDHEWIIAQDI